MDLLLVSSLAAALTFYLLIIIYTTSMDNLRDELRLRMSASRKLQRQANFKTTIDGHLLGGVKTVHKLSLAKSYGRRRLRQRLWQLYRQQLLIPVPEHKFPDALYGIAQKLYANAINETLPKHDLLLSAMAEAEAGQHTPPSVQWQRSGLSKLTAFIQSRIHVSQHPVDCSQRRFLVCPFKNENGFGAEQHQIAHCLIVAAALGRTMLIKDGGANWHFLRMDGTDWNETDWMVNNGLDIRGWSALFEPVSNCTAKHYFTADNSTSEVTYSAANHSTLIKETARVIHVTAPSNEIRVDQLPLALPEELAGTLLAYHSFPPLFFLAHFRHYLMRGNELLRSQLMKALKVVPFNKGPIVGLQVRRSDKIIGEARGHPVEKYMYWVEAWFRVQDKRRQLEHSKRTSRRITAHVPLPRRVYIATDEVEVIFELRYKYPHYDFYANEAAAREAKGNRYTTEAIIKTVIDIQLLAKCSYLVCTFSSQMCRLPYELMQVEAVNGDMLEAAHSLDDVHHFYWMQDMEHVAVESHHRDANADTDGAVIQPATWTEDPQLMPPLPGQHLMMRVLGVALSTLHALYRSLSQTPKKWNWRGRILPNYSNFTAVCYLPSSCILMCIVLGAILIGALWYLAMGIDYARLCTAEATIIDAWIGSLLRVTGLACKRTKRNASEPCTTSVENCGLILPEEDRFLTFNMHGINGPNRDEMCGGLGNQIFRLTGMYGIGRRVGRRPYFANEVTEGGAGDGRGLCMMRLRDEFASIFPDMLPLLYQVDPPPTNSTMVRTGYHCCLYEDVIPQLSRVPAETKFVRLWPGDNYQHYWYFAGYEKEVAGMMRFNETLLEKVAESAKKIFGDESPSHKLCLHSRRGDFTGANWHTKMPFVVGAIDFVAPMLKYNVNDRSQRRNISLMMLGEDRAFLEEAANYAKNQTNYFNKVYVVQFPTRGEDLCFAVTYCDSVVITASHSTFSWWIAFLVWMNGRGPIFYDGALTSGNLHGRTNFLPEWIPLKYVPGSLDGGQGGGKNAKVHPDTKAKVMIDDPKSLKGYATGLAPPCCR